MEIADADRDGVLSFEEYMHSVDDLTEKMKEADSDDKVPKDKKANSKQDDLPDI